jgi:outer membrane lipoprotein SlyB
MQQAAKVEQAVVVGMRQVRVTASGTVGAATGAAAGAALGAVVPGTDLARALTGIGGGLLGGAVGSGIERAGGDASAFEYILRKPDGELLSVTQRDKTPLVLGTAVLVITGPQARVVADYTVPAASPTAPPQAGAGVTDPAREASTPAPAAVQPVAAGPTSVPGAADAASTPAAATPAP